MVFQEAWDVLMLRKRWYYLMDSTGIWVWSPLKVELRSIMIFSSLCICLFSLPLFLFCLCLLNLHHLPSCCLSGVWWTQKMSSVTSNQSRCHQRYGTGWPPPSPARWAWCCDAMKRNLASAASFTLSRLEYLLRGKCVYVCTQTHCHWCWILYTDCHLYLPSSEILSITGQTKQA